MGGNFYQKKNIESKLRAYSRVFKTAEIDSTFYRNPSKGTVMGWLKYSPSDFIFSAKLPKTITHDKVLGLKKDVKADLEVFLDLMRPLQLGGKLACLLIQLPPKYSYNPKNLEAFFQILDPTFRYAVEFRNMTWLLPATETFALLKQYGVAYTIVDEPLLPPEMHLTADFAYFRWHGKGKDIWFDYRYSERSSPGFQRSRKQPKTSKKSMDTSTTTIRVTLQRIAYAYLKSLDCYLILKKRLKKSQRLSSRNWVPTLVKT